MCFTSESSSTNHGLQSPGLVICSLRRMSHIQEPAPHAKAITKRTLRLETHTNWTENTKNVKRVKSQRLFLYSIPVNQSVSQSVRESISRLVLSHLISQSDSSHFSVCHWIALSSDEDQAAFLSSTFLISATALCGTAGILLFSASSYYCPN